jgi:hypothetical protein
LAVVLRQLPLDIPEARHAAQCAERPRSGRIAMSDAAAKTERWLTPRTRDSGWLFGFALLTVGGGVTVLWVIFLCWTAGWLMNLW